MNSYILLTGANSGIGQTIAKKLSIKHNLILCARDTNRLQSTRNSLHNPKNHKIFLADLNDITSLEKSIHLLLQEMEIESFIHCAGINYASYAKKFSYEEMLFCANVNLYSAMSICKALLKKNTKKYLKNIIFISSIASKKCEAGDGFYASTKAGLDAYMKSLSLELAPEIKVNSILPGTIFDTKMAKIIYDSQTKERVLKKYPLGEGRVEDIAEAVAFLLQSGWITGQQIVVDGGYSV
ncbi:SDR family oxidoreductase [Helicobacter sp. 11S03491-1]|uniref:SDR family oxidoreductase n=1 Tax=Helicobacter sp. 11S03491-1 TaxID=1476196 RepID=UPI000BA68CAF|nr:SDR family oxidoreductase [Helicobacter sp. 11S03491-1]PAF43776.1 hypothetical protein BKH45_00470 [Helicobacter sp. 11S03491-1]